MNTKTMNNFIGDEDEYDYDCENHSQIRAIIGDSIIDRTIMYLKYYSYP